MNGIIKLTDGIATIENGIITSDNIITSNIITDDINLNIGDGRHLSLIDDLNDKAYYTDILSLSGIIYNYENIKNNNVNIINSEIITLSSTIRYLYKLRSVCLSKATEESGFLLKFHENRVGPTMSQGQSNRKAFR